MAYENYTKFVYTKIFLEHSYVYYVFELQW